MKLFIKRNDEDKARLGIKKIYRRKNLKFAKLGSILSGFEFSRDKYISHEWQKYGYDLSMVLNDRNNVSLYIKLAKTTPRSVLDAAVNFVKDASNVRSRPKLFMWKLNQLKKAKKINNT